MKTITLDKPALTAIGVRVERGGIPFATVPDLEASGGQSIAIVGASGSGKTTALMALAGVRPPGDGAIEVEGVDIWGLTAPERDRLRGRRIGLVFQSFHLVDALNVVDNLALAAHCAGLKEDVERVEHLLDRLDIADIAFQRADRISHGQAQRVAVARALFNRPAVILADEPTSALDDANTALLLGLLKEAAAAEDAALILATHDRRVLDAVDSVIEMVPN